MEDLENPLQRPTPKGSVNLHALPQAFRLGDFLVEPGLNRICRGDTNTQIRPKAMELLLYLSARQGELVSRDQLIEAIWEDNEFVGNRAVTDTISYLRKVFGDGASQPIYFQTIPKKGYRLLQPAVPVSEAARGNPQSTAPIQRPRRISRRVTRFWLSIAALTGLALMGTYIAREDVQGLPKVQFPEPVTTFPGSEYQPTFSPNGSKMAFVRKSPGKQQVVTIQSLVDPDLPLISLTDETENHSRPAWSPDGQRLAFTKEDNCGGNLILTNLQTGHSQALPSSILTPRSHLEWSPNGRQLLYSAFRNEFEGGGLYILDLHNMQEREITYTDGEKIDHSARWSPDGESLAFIRPATFGKRSIFLWRAGVEEEISPQGIQVSLFAWRPSGTEIVFSSPEYPKKLLQLRLANGEVDVLETDVDFPADINFAPDGSLFLTKIKVSLQVQSIDLAQPNFNLRPDPLIRSFRNDHSPAYNPHLDKLAFVSDRTGRPEIWQANLDGSGQRQLTFFEGGAYVPTWSPDGSAVAFVGWVPEEEKFQVFIQNLGSQVTDQVTDGVDNYAGIPRWSLDGKGIYVGRERGPLWEMVYLDLASRQTRILVPHVFLAKESADGKFLYYTRSDEPGIWRFRADGKGSQELVVSEDPLDTQWDLTEDGILFIMPLEETVCISFFDFETGKSRILKETAKAFLHHNNFLKLPGQQKLIFGGLEAPEMDIFRLASP